MSTYQKIISGLLIVLGAIFVGVYFFTSSDVPAESEMHGDVVGQVQEKNEERTDDVPSGTIASHRTVHITDGVKHTVPLRDIRSGGPGKDGIPPIDNPKFESAAKAGEWLREDSAGIAVSIDGVHRFYPFSILVWHEIVNDSINGQRILVTYCPLCLSGIVFDPVVQGERVEFGTSGKLWNSNLIMYDRKTDTYWSQVLGEAIRGELAGQTLSVLPSDQIRFKEFKANFPQGEVLTRKTGAFRDYDRDPYGDYYTDDRAVFFPVDNVDSRLDAKDFVLGIVVDGKAKAYYPPAVQAAGEIEDTYAGKTIVARYEHELEAVRLYEKLPDGTLERINPFASFWFSWVAVHPDTELYK